MSRKNIDRMHKYGVRKDEEKTPKSFEFGVNSAKTCKV